MVAVEYMGKLLDDVLKQFSLRRVGCVVSDKKINEKYVEKIHSELKKPTNLSLRFLGEILVEVYF